MLVRLRSNSSNPFCWSSGENLSNRSLAAAFGNESSCFLFSVLYMAALKLSAVGSLVISSTTFCCADVSFAFSGFSVARVSSSFLRACNSSQRCWSSSFENCISLINTPRSLPRFFSSSICALTLAGSSMFVFLDRNVSKPCSLAASRALA